MADFATVSELEAWMGTTGLGARGTSMLAHSSALIRGYTGQDLEATPGRQEEYAADLRTVITLTQTPVTAVTSVTIDAVSFTDFQWTRWGMLTKNDGWWWDNGPIVVTYDSGYAVGSDEMLQIKQITLEVAARALDPQGTPFETYGAEAAEGRGMAASLFLTEQERQQLDRFQMATVG